MPADATNQNGSRYFALASSNSLPSADRLVDRQLDLVWLLFVCLFVFVFFVSVSVFAGQALNLVCMRSADRSKLSSSLVVLELKRRYVHAAHMCAMFSN